MSLEGLPAPAVELWRLMLAALVADLDEEGVVAVADRLLLAGADRRVVVGGESRRRAAAQTLRGERLAGHEISTALAGLTGEDLLLLLAGGDERVRGRVRRELCELRPFTLGVRGADLVAAGVAPGPAIGTALRRTREARLDGAIDAGEELEFALRAAAGEAPPAGEGAPA